MANKFIPYANEADVLHIGGLMIENRLDRITISGDIDLSLDQAGLADARALHALLGDVLAQMEAQSLPANLPAADVKTVKNPFE
ncbi:hypothetical protein ASD15_10085 [Massilia sp. Root351]|uniref:hypothetical protein n=1 Tax=Massilia sp. Root351 TaxID=1736522 RepID=UPI00070B68C1|nr:hypothetical protein [Massilia sp. Root351]KQV82378.1 hypothetical protein ASD15_10085 [Massilia sp. Root351]